MKKFVILFVCLFCIGCITGKQIKVTDPKTGNSVMINEDGVEVDVKTIENDKVVIEVEDEGE